MTFYRNCLRCAPSAYNSGKFTVALLLVASVPTANAFEWDTGIPELRTRWDNTVKYSAAWRTKSPSSALIDGQKNLNLDDGDRSFGRGLISNRLDLFSELDLEYQNFGARLSGAAWYDDVYNRSNDNNSPSTNNNYSASYNHFTEGAQKLHGRQAELLDAFVSAQGEIGDIPISGRVGQFAMQWGESLFYGMNGIAGGMAPTDTIKAQSVPNSQFKEIIRPVQQISTQIQLTPDVTVGAYYQLKWEASRFAASGSYFSSVDAYSEQSERLLVGAPLTPGGQPLALYHGRDVDAKNSGQGGLQVRWQTDEVDWGIYAIRYNDKSPELLTRFGFANLDPASGREGEYYWVYGEGIESIGTSFSTTLLGSNVAGELSSRWHQPLASTSQRPLLQGENINNYRDPLYATGHTLHANLSWMSSFGPSWVAQEASFTGEVAWNRTLSITLNPDALDPNADRDAWQLRTVYEPTYRQVIPGLDISVPVGMSYGRGKSSALGVGFGVDRGGDMNIGVKGTYDSVWNLGLNYTHYYGPEGGGLDESGHYSYLQAWKDRDFVSFSVSRTF